MCVIVDSHTHYIPPEIAQKTTFYKMHWSDIDKHLHVMDQFGIKKSILLYPTSDAHVNMKGWSDLCHIYNQKIADVVNKYPSRFIGAGILPIDHSEKILQELKRIEDLGLKMLSLASSYDGRYLDDKMFYPVYEFAQNKNLLIHVHPQVINPIGENRVRDPLLTPALEYVFDVSMCIGKLMMNEVFLRFPTLIFIFAHFGGVLPILKERFDNIYQMLRKRNFVKDLSKNPTEYFKNLYFDTSGAKSPSSLACALEMTDASHILWGSDYPANQNLSNSISTFSHNSLTKDAKELIFSSNISRLLQINV